MLLIDSISGLGVMECGTDDLHIDISVTGSQKALMLPPGLAFASVSDKAWQRIDKNTAARNFYFDLRKYREALKQGDTPFTPANSLIRALRHSLKMIRAEGLQNMWQPHARVPAAARDAPQALRLVLCANLPATGGRSLQ